MHEPNNVGSLSLWLLAIVTTLNDKLSMATTRALGLNNLTLNLNNLEAR